MQEEPLRMPMEQKGEDISSAPTILYVQHSKQLCRVPVLLTAKRLFCLNMKMLPECRSAPGARLPAGVVISGYFLEALCNHINQIIVRTNQLKALTAQEKIGRWRPGEREQLIALLFFHIIPALALYKPLMQAFCSFSLLTTRQQPQHSMKAYLNWDTCTYTQRSITLMNGSVQGCSSEWSH